VLFRRYGDSESHTYLGGTYGAYEKAELQAKAHMVDRAGKYDAEIYECYLDETEKLYRVIRWGDFDPSEAEKNFEQYCKDKSSALQEE